MTLQECRQFELPDDCSVLGNPGDIRGCKECKILIAAEEEIPEQEEEKEIEEDIPVEEIEEGISKEEEIPEKPSFFERIINFFKNLFGLTEKEISKSEELQDVKKKIPEIVPEVEGELPEIEHVGPGGPPPGIPLSVLIKGGPGGCRGPDCGEVCKNDPKICDEWCDENPEACAILFGGGSGKPAELVPPPDTKITFAKTVNLVPQQYTEEDILRAKAMGANMVTIWPARLTKEDDLSFLPSLGNIPGMINFAHQNGLQVELRGTDVFPRANNYEKYKASAILHVAEWAKFAEKYKVYRMVPFGEVDNDFVNHPDKITEFAQEMLPEMRKHYSGQIGIGVIAPWRDSGFTFNGYDYLTFSAYPQNQDEIDDETDMDKWLTPNPDATRTIDNNNVALVVKWVREVADRSGVSTIHFGETGVINPGEEDQSDFNTVVVSKEKEAEYYEKMFSQISDKVDGLSVFYNSKVAFTSVYGDPAEEVVKDWYNRLGNS